MLIAALDGLRGIVNELGKGYPAPHFVDRAGGKVFRHEEIDRTPQLACYLKAVKICSTLRAALALVDLGHMQEAYALCRICDDQTDDIGYLVKPLGETGLMSVDQLRFLNEFYQEEFDKPDDPLASTRRRDRVPRRKVYAGIHKDAKDPSTALALNQTLQRTFSGYVHGAYSHIMDMYGGNPGSYHMCGMLDTPRIPEALRTIPHYLYRGMMAVEGLALLTGRVDLATKLRTLSDEVQKVALG
jgi:hypothetical protein